MVPPGAVVVVVPPAEVVVVVPPAPSIVSPLGNEADWVWPAL